MHAMTDKRTNPESPKATSHSDSRFADSSAQEPWGNLSIASDELQQFLADIEDLIKASSSLTNDNLARAKAKLSDCNRAAKESQTTASSISSSVKHLSGNYLNEKPWQVVGASCAIGFVLGLIITHGTRK